MRNQDSWRRRGEKGKRGMTEVLLVATIFLSAKHNPSYTPLGSTASANARTAEEVLVQTNIPLLSVFLFVASIFNLNNIVSAEKPVVCSSGLPAPDGRRANPNKATAVLRFLLVVRRRSSFLSSFLSTSSFSLHQVCTSQNPRFVSLIS